MLRYLSVVVNARDEAVEVEQVERCAECVPKPGEPRRLQVLQLAHEGSVVLLPACLERRQTEFRLRETGAGEKARSRQTSADLK